MGNEYTASNALGVGCKAEGELIGLALRYEPVRGVRLNWRKDRDQTLRAISDSMNDRDSEFRSRARRFWDSLSAGERQAIHAGLSSETRGQAPIAATLVPESHPVLGRAFDWVIRIQPVAYPIGAVIRQDLPLFASRSINRWIVASND